MKVKIGELLLGIMSILCLMTACSKDDEPQYDNETQEKLINDFLLQSPKACWLTTDMVMENDTINLSDKGWKNDLSFASTYTRWEVNDKYSLIINAISYRPFPITKCGAKINYKAVETDIVSSFYDLKVAGIVITSDYDEHLNYEPIITDYYHTEAGELKDFSNCNFEFEISPNNTGKPRYIIVWLESEGLYNVLPVPGPQGKWRRNVDFIQYAE